MVLALFSGTAAHAVDVWFADDSAPQGKVGLVWVEDVTRGNSLSYLQSFSNTGLGVACSTLADERCRDGNWSAQLILPPCTSTIVEACIEGMSVGNESGALTQGKLVRTINSPKVDAYPNLKVPYGGSPSVWQVAGQNHSGGNNKYAVIASLYYVNGQGLTKFQAGIVPINEVTGDYRQMQLTYAAGTTDLVFDHHIGNCVFQEVGNCAVAQQWQENAIGSLSLRVPQSVTGWMYGRISEPTLSVSTALGGPANLLTVTGKPVTVEGSKPLIDFPNLPAEMENFLSDGGRHPLRKDGGYAQGGYVWQIPTDTNNFDWYDKWFPYTNDRADGLVDYWNIKSIPNQFSSPKAQECLGGKTNLVGLVTSNSLWYTGNPPEFDGKTLNYKVAALHYGPDGVTPFKGSYDLVIQDSAAKCLYGNNSLPDVATVEIVNANGSSTITSNTIVRQNGWLRLSVKGFTYSSPIIKVNLDTKPVATASPSPTNVAEPTPTASVTASPTPTKSIAAKKTTITCVKGKVVKKVSAIKPICPKGYKKK